MATTERPVTPAQQTGPNAAHKIQDSPSSGVVCPSCGTLCAATPGQLSGDAQRRIAELEAQVRILTDKASKAADRIADYEDELRRQRSDSVGNTNDTDEARRASETVPVRKPVPATAASRFSALLSRRSSPNLQQQRLSSQSQAPPLPNAQPSPQAPAPPPQQQRPDAELTLRLERETSLRQAAETQLTQMSTELEDLSATLFSQANEMVATERRARAKLEERVELLERRDREKRVRLERLEGAVRRIERVRDVLGGKGVSISVPDPVPAVGIAVGGG